MSRMLLLASAPSGPPKGMFHTGIVAGQHAIACLTQIRCEKPSIWLASRFPLLEQSDTANAAQETGRSWLGPSSDYCHEAGHVWHIVKMGQHLQGAFHNRRRQRAGGALPVLGPQHVLGHRVPRRPESLGHRA